MMRTESNRRAALAVGWFLAAAALVAVPFVWWGAKRAAAGGRLAGPSAVIYPKQTMPLVYSHKLHLKHSMIKCKNCHPKAYTSRRGKDVLIPRKKECVACHAFAKIPKGFGRAGNRDRKNCKKCHTRYLPTGFPVPVRMPKPRVKFSHKLHLDKGSTCDTCHPKVRRKKMATRADLPRMKQCMDCHRRRKASNKCTACHEKRDGHRMRVRYPEGKLIPTTTLGILAHGPNFKKKHRVAAGARKKDCKACHTDRSCLKCHAGVRKVFSIHAGNYKLRHGADARRNSTRCQSCHTRQRFCLGCHQRMGVTKTSKRSPYSSTRPYRYHPTNWSSGAARGLRRNRHAVHARRNLGACVGCHRQSTCIRCHGSRAIRGLGVNPHPPNFGRSRRCRILAKRNKRACIKCHMSRDPALKCR